MSVKIWDAAAGAWRDAETPKIYDAENSAYRDSTGLVQDAENQAWKEVWSPLKPVGIINGNIVGCNFEEYSHTGNGTINGKSTTKNTGSVTVALTGTGQISYSYLSRLKGLEIKQYTSLIINAAVSLYAQGDSKCYAFMGLTETYPEMWHWYNTIQNTYYTKQYHGMSTPGVQSPTYTEEINLALDLSEINWENEREYYLVAGVDHHNYNNCDMTINVVNMYLV